MKLNNLKIKNIIAGVIGIVLCGFGSGMLVKTGYGADTLNAFFTGLVKITNLSLGTINAIFNASMIIVIFLVDRKLVGIGMILSIFLLPYPIDLAVSIWPSSPNIFLGLISDVVSLMVFSFGASLMIESHLGSTVYDGLSLILAEKTKKPFKTIRYICDGTALLLGFIFKGEIGMGTVLSFFCMGYFIEFHRHYLSKIMN